MAKHRAQLENTQTTKECDSQHFATKRTAAFGPLDAAQWQSRPSLAAPAGLQFNLVPESEDLQVTSQPFLIQGKDPSSSFHLLLEAPRLSRAVATGSPGQRNDGTAGAGRWLLTALSPPQQGRGASSLSRLGPGGRTSGKLLTLKLTYVGGKESEKGWCVAPGLT